MGIFDKKDIVKIAQEDLNDAKLSSVAFKEENIKRKAFINILGARLAMNLLFSKKIKANNLYSLYTTHNVLGQLDISDIYYNGIKIDVRIVFNENEIFIPKSHFERGILPDLYLVLALSQDLSSTELLGCFEPKDIDKDLHNDDCYFIEQESLNKPKQLKNFLDNFVVEHKVQSTQEDIEKAESLFLALIDCEITEKEKTFLFQQLANNFVLREKLVEFENFELVSKRVAEDKTIASDGVLEIIGAQKIFNEAEAAEEAGLEIETETINFINDLEELQFEAKEETKSKNSFAGTLADGAVMAGSAAIAGGIIAAGAAGVAAMAQSSAIGATASATSAAVEGVVSIGSSIVEHITSTDNSANNKFFEELASEEKVVDYTDEEFDELIFAEESDGELEFLDEMSETELLDEEKTEELSRIEEIGEIEETFEVEDFKEEGQSFEPIEETTNAELLNINDETEFATLNELPVMGELAELAELPELSEELFEETDKKEDTVDLDSFDFGMFDEEALDEHQQDQPQTAEAHEEGTFSFDDIADDGVKEKAEEVEDIEVQLEEIDDEDIEEKSKSDDINNISSQVDNLLNDIELSDEQKSILSEINIEMDTEEKKEEEIKAYTPAIDTNIDLLTATGPIEDDQDLLNALFQKENINIGGGEYGQEGQLELGEREKTPNAELMKKKKIIIAASVAGIMLVSIVAGNIVNKKEEVTFPASTQNSSISPDMPAAEAPTAPDMPEGLNEVPMDAGAALSPQAEQMQPNRDMGKAVSDAFASEPMNASVSKIAWEVPEELAYNDSFRKYLQIAGKNLKLTLSNDLLLTSEMAYSNKMIIDLKISKDGAVQASNVVVSSGSKQIDGIVLQSVKETLKYLKIPSAEVNGQSVNATLIINF
jgi:hypothetical protein